MVKERIPKPSEIRRARLRHDLTQVEFAKLMRVSHASVSQWERGKKSMSIHTAMHFWNTIQRLDAAVLEAV